MRHLERPPVLGVDPRLVLRFELGSPVDRDEFRLAGLRVLDASDRSIVVAFADDPALAAFHERLDALRAGPPEGQKSEPYAAFFDAIDEVRVLRRDDRVTPALAAGIEESDPDVRLRLDVECWHPDDHNLARAWLDDLAQAVTAAGGEVADRYIHDRAGLLLARVYVPAGRIHEVADLDFVARIDVLPKPSLSLPQLFGGIEHLPEVHPPLDAAPVVGLVDSGVQSAHPLLAGAIVAAEPLGTGITEGEDEHGHGTMVAGIILHGRLDYAVAAGRPLRALCRIASARVLDSQNQFPADDVWERDLAEAIEWCADQGATIINLSIGDDRSVFSGLRQLTAAALVDDLAKRRDLVVVCSTGNVPVADYLENADDASTLTYPTALVSFERARLIDPAPAMLALTVGGTTESAAATGLTARESVVRVPMGQPGWPSPFTRVGPGVSNAIKPEVVSLSGTLGVENGRLVDNDAELSVISAGLGGGLAFDRGTSFATPFVTRVAAAVKARFPTFSANMIRALVLVSATPPTFADLTSDSAAAQADSIRRLMGHGHPSIERATQSTTHRAVLVSEDSIPINGVHIYEIPVPTSFFESGGTRGIDVALAYNPRTRASRIDYLANTMQFYVVRGMTVEDVAKTFAALGPEEIAEDPEGAEDEESPSADADGDEDPATTDEPPTPSKLGASNCKLLPTVQVRSRGANQLGRVTFRTRLDASKHSPMYLVIRNINRWDDEGALQPYAVATTLWRSETHSDLYAELEAQLEAVVEVPLEVRLEA